MALEDEIRAKAEEQGWTDYTLLNLLINVLDTMGSTAEVTTLTYLQAVADEENSIAEGDDEGK